MRLDCKVRAASLPSSPNAAAAAATTAAAAVAATASPAAAATASPAAAAAAAAAAWLCEAGAAIEMEGHPYVAHRRARLDERDGPVEEAEHRRAAPARKAAQPLPPRHLDARLDAGLELHRVRRE